MKCQFIVYVVCTIKSVREQNLMTKYVDLGRKFWCGRVDGNEVGGDVNRRTDFKWSSKLEFLSNVKMRR